jgi:hypothetical protein
VMEKGRIVADYPSSELRKDPERVEAILSLGGSKESLASGMPNQ